MSFKDLYSEVKKRKMQALNKKDVVKAVEKHGKILAVDGKFEKVKKVIKYMYASEKEIIKTRNLKDILKIDLNRFDVVLLGCPGNNIPRAAHPKIKKYVEQGGWIISTDWVIKSIVEPVFPGFIRWNGNRSDDAVVSCQILEPNHPFLDGVVSEISKSKWKSKSTKKEEFQWWLENRSFPIQILNHQAVRVLIASWELKNKWGEAPVLVYFDYGKRGGRVIHMISHTHLQKGGEKGKYASALILTNILDEKIALKMGISKQKPGPAAPRYQDPNAPQQNQNQNYVTPQMPPSQSTPSNQSAFEENWVFSSQNESQQNDYVTPNTVGSGGGEEGSSGGGIGLTATSKIIETDVNDPSFSFADKCAYCEYDFGEYEGKVFTCKECGAHYHQNCINQQVQEGVCKQCGKILLW